VEQLQDEEGSMMSRKRAGDIIAGIRRYELGWEDLNGKAFQDGEISLLKEGVLLYRTGDGVTNFKIIISKAHQKRAFGELSESEQIKAGRALFKEICETDEVEFVKGKTYCVDELGVKITVRRAKYGPVARKAA
jgi:hypothetical protein